MNTAIIDRIEGNKVILLQGNISIIKDKSLFSENVREGDVVDLETFQINHQVTENRKKEVRGLLGKIFKN